MNTICLKIISSVLLVLVPITYIHAQSNSDSRFFHVKYHENQVTPLRGKTFTATQVIFGEDEVVIGVEGGDSMAWMVTHPPEVPNMVFIKPTVLASDSNMTIVTNKHSYYFHLSSNKTLDEQNYQQTYAIKFSYPEEEALNARMRAQNSRRAAEEVIDPSKHPEKYNWNYNFSGSSQLTPAHVFDDGTFTYLELAKNQAVPAVFSVDNSKGKESVVNTRRSGNYLIVQQIAPQFTLRHGGMVTSIFNTNEIIRIKQGRRPV